MQIIIISILDLARILDSDLFDVPLLAVCGSFENYSFWLKYILLWLIFSNVGPKQKSEYSGRVTYQFPQMW